MINIFDELKNSLQIPLPSFKKHYRINFHDWLFRPPSRPPYYSPQSRLPRCPTFLLFLLLDDLSYVFTKTPTFVLLYIVISVIVSLVCDSITGQSKLRPKHYKIKCKIYCSCLKKWIVSLKSGHFCYWVLGTVP